MRKYELAPKALSADFGRSESGVLYAIDAFGGNPAGDLRSRRASPHGEGGLGARTGSAAR